MAKNAHLTREDRVIIETGLTNGSTRKSIADTLGKNNSTICKEVKANSYLKTYTHPYMRKGGTYDCQKISQCGYNGFCKQACSSIDPIPCKRRDRKVGVCNGCDEFSNCKLNKKMYEADWAQSQYEYTLKDAREGINLTTKEATALGAILKDGIGRGLSIYAIKQAHPEIRQSEKTLYNYIDQGVFSSSGLVNIDLPEKVGRKVRKQKIRTKVRKDKAYLNGRTYKDFEIFLRAHPNLSVVEMDTVYNDAGSGPFVQTFMFPEYNLMIGMYHEEKTAAAMYQGVKKLKEWLGNDFVKIVPILLTDRGTEFVMAKEIEALGCRIFYCDPMASCQKPHVENNHRLFRKVCPKKMNLRQAGLDSQEKLNLVFSHINSYPREEKHGKSPVEIFKFFHTDSNLLSKLHIKEIDPDELQLNPSLLLKHID